MKMIYISVILIVFIPVCKSVNDQQIQQLVVNINKPMKIPCIRGNINSQFEGWSYIRVGQDIEIGVYDTVSNKVRQNYKAQCDGNQYTCNLTVLRATWESAGKYFCKIVDNQVMANAAVVELIVVDIRCDSNIKTGQTMIGPNDCEGVEADILERSCSISSSGNQMNRIRIGWIKRNKITNDKVEEHVNSIGNKTFVKSEDKIEITKNMDQVIFECYIEDFPQIEPCSLPDMAVKYIKLLKETTRSVNINDFQDFPCSVDHSTDVQCSYFWNTTLNGNQTSISRTTLTKVDVHASSIYSCFATCQFAIDRKCFVKVFTLEVTEQNKTAVVAIAVSVTLIAVVAIGIIIFYFIRKRSKKNRNNTEKKTENIKKNTIIEKSLVLNAIENMQKIADFLNKEPEEQVQNITPVTLDSPDIDSTSKQKKRNIVHKLRSALLNETRTSSSTKNKNTEDREQIRESHGENKTDIFQKFLLSEKEEIENMVNNMQKLIDPLEKEEDAESTVIGSDASVIATKAESRQKSKNFFQNFSCKTRPQKDADIEVNTDMYLEIEKNQIANIVDPLQVQIDFWKSKLKQEFIEVPTSSENVVPKKRKSKSPVKRFKKFISKKNSTRKSETSSTQDKAMKDKTSTSENMSNKPSKENDQIEEIRVDMLKIIEFWKNKLETQPALCNPEASNKPSRTFGILNKFFSKRMIKTRKKIDDSRPQKNIDFARKENETSEMNSLMS